VGAPNAFFLSPFPACVFGRWSYAPKINPLRSRPTFAILRPSLKEGRDQKPDERLAPEASLPTRKKDSSDVKAHRQFMNYSDGA
jgi:hypothetical protein